MSVTDTMCADCGMDVLPGHWYAVEDAVWSAAMTAGRAEFLCLDCLEGRLGRALRAADLIACPVNAPGWSLDSPRLFELKKQVYARHGAEMFPPPVRRALTTLVDRADQLVEQQPR